MEEQGASLCVAWWTEDHLGMRAAMVIGCRMGSFISAKIREIGMVI